MESQKNPLIKGYPLYRTLIPQDVIDMKILPRLPAKSLFRFKAVDRYWNCYISSYAFAKRHVQFQQIYNLDATVNLCFQTMVTEGFNVDPKLFPLKLLKLEVSDQRSVVNTGFNLELVNLQHGFELPHRMTEELIGSCNGLMCLKFTNSYYMDARQGRINNFLLWNPLLKLQRSIRGPYISYQSCIVSSGFGFASSTDDYKIILLEAVAGSYIVCRLFSSRRNRWTKVIDNECFPPALNSDGWYMDRITRPVLANETFYWFIRGTSQDSKIVALDINTESFSLVPFPDNIQMQEIDMPQWIFLCKIRQFLCVCCMKANMIANGYVDLRVWMLQDNSWTDLFQFRNLNKYLWHHRSYISSQTWFEIQGHNEGAKVLCLGICREHLVSIHISDRGPSEYRIEKYKDIPFKRNESISNTTFSYVESFVSPFYNVDRPPITRKAKMRNSILGIQVIR